MGPSGQHAARTQPASATDGTQRAQPTQQATPHTKHRGGAAHARRPRRRPHLYAPIAAVGDSDGRRSRDGEARRTPCNWHPGRFRKLPPRSDGPPCVARARPRRRPRPRRWARRARCSRRYSCGARLTLSVRVCARAGPARWCASSCLDRILRARSGGGRRAVFDGRRCRARAATATRRTSPSSSRGSAVVSRVRARGGGGRRPARGAACSCGRA